MQYIFDNLGIIIFIGFIIMSTVFNAVGSIIKKNAEAAENSRDYQKSPQKFNPLGEESAEEFFSKMQSEQPKPAKKLKLSKKPSIKNETPAPTNSIEEEYNPQDLRSDKIEKVLAPVNKKTKKAHIVDMKDKSSLRNAIILGEVLGRPSSYKY